MQETNIYSDGVIEKTCLQGFYGPNLEDFLK